MSFDTVPTGFEQAGENSAPCSQRWSYRALLPSSCCVLFSGRHVFVTAQLPPWFPARIMALRDGGHSTTSKKAHAKKVYDPAVSLDNLQIINQAQLVTEAALRSVLLRPFVTLHHGHPRFQSVFNGSDEQTTAGHVFACGSF